MRTAGLPVDHTLGGEPWAVHKLGPVIYRLLQEGLTNVVRHARLVPTQTAVRIGADAVKLRS